MVDEDQKARSSSYLLLVLLLSFFFFFFRRMARFERLKLLATLRHFELPLSEEIDSGFAFRGCLRLEINGGLLPP